MVEADVEAAPVCAGSRKPVENQSVGIVRQLRIGVQEQQHIAARLRRAGVHLRCASARGGDDTVAQRRGPLGRAIAAAAIGDDHLDAARAVGLQGRERRLDAGGLVQHRHDDGEFHLSFLRACFTAVFGAVGDAAVIGVISRRAGRPALQKAGEESLPIVIDRERVDMHAVAQNAIERRVRGGRGRDAGDDAELRLRKNSAFRPRRC